jgi:transporter family protein|uniref:EamA family transporter n=1 Tax=candidate division WOR-3 bacterium TaxID=2052148 RepID=A0A7V3UZD1_UNCW3
MDYRILSIFTLLLWGAWGLMTKILTRDTPAETVAFWSTLASILPILIYTVAAGTMHWVKSAPLAIISGLSAGLATVCFYLALKGGPASVVLPLTGMYIVVPAVLGYLLLREPLNVNHLFGIIFAVLAIIFLSR